MAIVFAGGPAPAANAVISTAAASFLRHGIEVLGILHGYAHLVEYGDDHPMEEGRDYMVLDQSRLKRTRNTRGILIGTSRTNPGKDVSSPAHLQDPERTAVLRTVHRALDSLGVDALISIGGDDTLKTANKFKRFQEYLPADARRIKVVHVPKTIDNDYRGIDFTFGYFTAVEFLASEIRNLLADAEAGRMYFLVETMGRSAGWLAYGACIAGEASKVISVEDLDDELMTEETRHGSQDRPHDHPQGHGRRQARRADRPRHARARAGRQGIRRDRAGRGPGPVPAVELPPGRQFDEHGHISLPADRAGQEPLEEGGGRVPAADRPEAPQVTGVQLGYEARCAAARIRRHPGQSARRRLLPRPGRERPRRRPGLGRRPVKPQLRPVRGAG